MEEVLIDILDTLRAHGELDEKKLGSIIMHHCKVDAGAAEHGVAVPRAIAKRDIAPYYLSVKKSDPERWASWKVSPELEERLLRCLRMKPRRTASGVATITVLTRPWPCSGNCVFCPSDLRMPKSYLHDEPACQRAEANHFDPYLQVTMRLRALTEMGHPTDKIELIVLGGTWSDYPASYQRWFIRELYRALNDSMHAQGITDAQERYIEMWTSREHDFHSIHMDEYQAMLNEGKLTYNEAVHKLYDHPREDASLEEVLEQHRLNEHAQHRVVGLSLETRPDAVTPENLALARQLGATKIQIGVQSCRQEILDICGRATSTAQIKHAFELLRLFGFKIHTHLMANLPGSTLAGDMADYRELTESPAYKPDEIKLYPCVLIEGTALARAVESAPTGEPSSTDNPLATWKPYTEDELIELMADQLAATPPFVRVSRMIRDFSADDIKAGNKKGNLRQMVDQRLAQRSVNVQEIRSREIARNAPAPEDLHLDEVPFDTTISKEYFLQWVTPENKIAGFLRLSLPKAEAIEALGNAAPISPTQAMIREVHIYGEAARIDEDGKAAQHLGLGRKLIERACEIARKAGYTSINVISSVGTRNYYRKLGFVDADLYQNKTLPTKELS